MPKNSNTTDDEKFKKVVGHFLNTPPKPHKDMKKGTAKENVNQNTVSKKAGDRHRRSSSNG